MPNSPKNRDYLAHKRYRGTVQIDPYTDWDDASRDFAELIAGFCVGMHEEKPFIFAMKCVLRRAWITDPNIGKTAWRMDDGKDEAQISS